MATLMPAIGACTSRMTPGERRLAERLAAEATQSIGMSDHYASNMPRQTHWEAKPRGYTAEGLHSFTKTQKPLGSPH